MEGLGGPARLGGQLGWGPARGCGVFLFICISSSYLSIFFVSIMYKASDYSIDARRGEWFFFRVCKCPTITNLLFANDSWELICTMLTLWSQIWISIVSLSGRWFRVCLVAKYSQEYYNLFKNYGFNYFEVFGSNKNCSIINYSIHKTVVFLQY